MNPFIDASKRAVARVENVLALLGLALVLILPLVRFFHRMLVFILDLTDLPQFLPQSLPLVEPLLSHFTLVFACIGTSIAGREGRQLGLADAWNPRGVLGATLASIRVFVSVTLLTAITIASIAMIPHAFPARARVAFIPARLFAAAIPLTFGLMTVRTSFRAARKRPLLAIFAVLSGLFAASGSIELFVASVSGSTPAWIRSLSSFWSTLSSSGAWPFSLGAGASLFTGVPLFLASSGSAFFAFSANGLSADQVPFAAYTALTENFIPAIPLFTFAGYILASSDAGRRLSILFRALFGGLRGGIAVSVILISSFFSPFIGSSGATILALGGLLSLTLKDNGYPNEKISGLLTASGSIGLLFPPSLAVIVYATVARVSLLDLFISSFIPGSLLVLAMSIAVIVGVFDSPKNSSSGSSLAKAFLDSLGELLFPFLIIAGYWSGFFSLTEIAAFAAAYVVVLEVLIRRDIAPRQLLSLALKSVPIAGGLLVILASANSLSNFFAYIHLPTILADLSHSYIPSRWVFLVALNLALFAIACFMDLFSAIVIVAPLILPAAEVFGLHPIHIGVLFLMNLSIGFLTPPVGMNLLIASTTFEKPVKRLAGAVFPYLIVQLAILVLVTFVPPITTLFLR